MVAVAVYLKKGHAISNSLNEDSEKTTTSTKEKKKKEEVSFEELQLLSIFVVLANRASSDQYRRATSGKRCPLPFSEN